MLAHLGLLPEQVCAGHQLLDGGAHLCSEAPLHTEVARANYAKGVGGQRAVGDGELSLKASGDVVAATPRVDHCRHELEVHDVGEVAWFLTTVEAPHVHQLEDNLIGHLGTPGGEGEISTTLWESLTVKTIIEGSRSKVD